MPGPERPSNGALTARQRFETTKTAHGATEALASNAETARALKPGAPPRAIAAAFLRHPFRVGKRIELDPTKPIPRGPDGKLHLQEGGGGLVTPAMADELRHPDKGAVIDGGAGVVNRVTPEQLLAIVVSLIATSKSATEACVRLRQEVTGWRFAMTEGGPKV